jgi:hypothetical protein
MKRPLALMFSALTFFGCAHSKPGVYRVPYNEVREFDKDGTEFRLRITPKIYLGHEAPIVRTYLQINNPTDKYYCPEVRWNWDDGESSSRESDCAPILESTGDGARYSFSGQHSYRTSGDFNVQAIIMRNGQVIKKINIAICVNCSINAS